MNEMDGSAQKVMDDFERNSPFPEPEREEFISALIEATPIVGSCSDLRNAVENAETNLRNTIKKQSLIEGITLIEGKDCKDFIPERYNTALYYLEKKIKTENNKINRAKQLNNWACAKMWDIFEEANSFGEAEKKLDEAIEILTVSGKDNDGPSVVFAAANKAGLNDVDKGELINKFKTIETELKEKNFEKCLEEIEPVKRIIESLPNDKNEDLNEAIKTLETIIKNLNLLIEARKNSQDWGIAKKHLIKNNCPEL